MAFDYNFFKSLALAVSEYMSVLQLSVSIQGVSEERRDYHQVVAHFPDYSHFAVVMLDQNPCVIHVGKALVTYLTDQFLGATSSDVLGDLPTITWTEQFVFKQLLEWLTHYFSERNVICDIQRIEHNNRNLHAFFHDETVSCVSIKLKIQAHSGTLIQFVFADEDVIGDFPVRKIRKVE